MQENRRSCCTRGYQSLELVPRSALMTTCPELCLQVGLSITAHPHNDIMEQVGLGLNEVDTNRSTAIEIVSRYRDAKPWYIQKSIRLERNARLCSGALL